MSHHCSPLIIPGIKRCVTRFGSFKHLQLLNSIKQGSNPIKTSIIHQKVPKKRQFEFLKYHLSVNWIQNLVPIIDRNEILMEQHTITQSKGNYVLSDFIWGSIIRQTKSSFQSFFPQLIIVCDSAMCYICCGTVVLQFALNEMRWSILRLSAGLDLNQAWWHVSIRDNILQQSGRIGPIPGLNIIPLI